MTSDNVKNAAKDIGKSASSASSDAASTARSAASNVSGAARDLGAQASENVSALYEKAQERLSTTADQLSEHANDAVAAGQRVYRDTSRTVAEQVVKQPVEALLLAAAIGYLVGWVTNRG